MRKLPTEEHVQLMHAINQAIAEGKTVMEGGYRIYGATFHKELIMFLYPAEVLEDYQTAQSRLPKMRCFRSSDVIIRAFLPTSTDVEVIYEPPSRSSVAVSQDLSEPSS